VKYLLMIYDKPGTRELFMSDEGQELIAATGAIVEELRGSGELIATEGLADPSNARSVRIEQGAPVVTDLSLAESKEHMGGYMLLDLESMERAVEIATRWPSAAHGRLEVWPVMGSAGLEM
jgi:hypothetical protein